MDYNVLKTWITQSPACAGFVASGNDAAIASILNTPGAGTVAVAEMTRGDLLLALVPAVAALATKDDATQKRWDRYLNLVYASTTIRVQHPSIQAVLNAAVADGLMTSEYRATIGQQAGTQAEVLFGLGTTVAPNDISFALRGLK